jgi:hypothetical protein
MPNFDPHRQLALDIMHTAEAGTWKYMVDGGSGVIWTVRHNSTIRLLNSYVYVRAAVSGYALLYLSITNYVNVYCDHIGYVYLCEGHASP